MGKKIAAKVKEEVKAKGEGKHVEGKEISKLIKYVHYIL